VHHGAFDVHRQDACIYCGECKKTAEAMDMQHLKNFIRISTPAPTQPRRRTATSSASKPSDSSPPSPSSRRQWPSSAKSSRKSRKASTDHSSPTLTLIISSLSCRSSSADLLLTKSRHLPDIMSLQ
jgi:hypothetical protein